MDIQDMFPDGEWKSNEEYLVRCPYCGDHPTHSHCYINVNSGMFYCHYCGEAGTAVRLSKDFGDGTLDVTPDEDYPVKVKYKDGIDFELFPKITGTKNLLDRMARTYLIQKRGMTEEEIESYNIRYTDYGKFYGRVIFPIYEDNKVVCFMARSFIEALTPPWRFPAKGETLLTASECLFCYDDCLETDSEKVVIVEGAFDAMNLNRMSKYPGLDYFSLSLQGKRLHDTQLNKLLRFSKESQFYIMLDSDARKAELEVGRKLRMYGRKVKLCQLETGDPGDMGYEWELADVLSNAKELDISLEVKELLDD